MTGQGCPSVDNSTPAHENAPERHKSRAPLANLWFQHGTGSLPQTRPTAQQTCPAGAMRAKPLVPLPSGAARCKKQRKPHNFHLLQRLQSRHKQEEADHDPTGLGGPNPYPTLMAAL
ncbi:hypothetical protein lerEdw1_014506 [Lerista edwardsae]|nr:hypothetical protein lerEdw1_014508 [Lerista edwardsae]KAJ6633411.1 hypothetical protein lerEdw1_014506 [Lerista edwardsae]